MSGPRFSIIPAAAVTDARIEPGDLQLLCLLGRHTNDLGWCRRSQVEMARELGRGRATIQRALARLIDAGWVEQRAEYRRDGGDAAHSYRVVTDVSETAAAASTAAVRKRTTVPAGGHGVPTQDGHPVPTHERAPNERPLINESERAREADGEEGQDCDEPPSMLSSDGRSVFDFLSAYGGTAHQDNEPIVAAWNRLSPKDRKAALDGIKAFEEERKRDHPRMGRLMAAKYLAQRKWEYLGKAVVEKIVAAPPTADGTRQVKNWSRDWWASLLYRVQTGQKVSFMMSFARSNPSSVCAVGPGTLPGDDRIAALTPYPADGEVMRRWSAWLASHGHHIDLGTGKFWAFLPSDHPPPGRIVWSDVADQRKAG